MRTVLAVFVLGMSACLCVTGCGGGKVAKQNEAAKPALRVLADAKAAAMRASSAQFSGTISWWPALHWFGGFGGGLTTLDVWTARGSGAKGSVTSPTGSCGAPECKGESHFDFVQIGDTAYVRGSDAFY